MVVVVKCMVNQKEGRTENKGAKKYANNHPNKKKYIYTFKVCKSVHHRTIQINHQPDATVFQFIILTFI